MHDRLPPIGMCSRSHNVAKFWKITDNTTCELESARGIDCKSGNISETVQDEDVVTAGR